MPPASSFRLRLRAARDCCFLLEKKRDFTVQRLLAMTRPWQVDAPDKARQKHPSRAPLARRKTSVECPQCKNHFLPESLRLHICPNAPMGPNLCALPFYRSSSQSWDKMTSRESLGDLHAMAQDAERHGIPLARDDIGRPLLCVLGGTLFPLCSETCRREMHGRCMVRCPCTIHEQQHFFRVAIAPYEAFDRCSNIDAARAPDSGILWLNEGRASSSAELTNFLATLLPENCQLALMTVSFCRVANLQLLEAIHRVIDSVCFVSGVQIQDTDATQAIESQLNLPGVADRLRGQFLDISLILTATGDHAFLHRVCSNEYAYRFENREVHKRRRKAKCSPWGHSAPWGQTQTQTRNPSTPLARLHL